MIIYKVTNLKNGKVYIGKSKRTLKARKKAHYSSAYNNKSETNFHRALRKFDKADFKWEVIESVDDKIMLNELEVKFIKEYNTYEDGYNMTAGGDGGLTYRKGDELYHRIKHKLGNWENGNPGATPEAIAKRVETFKTVDWPSGKSHGNYGHCHNKGILAGKNNPMYGKTPTNAKKVEINGVVYPSIAGAARTLNIKTSEVHKIGKIIND